MVDNYIGYNTKKKKHSNKVKDFMENLQNI